MGPPDARRGMCFEIRPVETVRHLTWLGRALVAVACGVATSCGSGGAGQQAPIAPPPSATPDAGSPQIEPRRPAPADDPNAPARLAAFLMTSSPDDAVDAVVEVFARAGVTVLEDDGATPAQALAGSPSPFVFARTEAAAFAREIASGRWRWGAALDAFVPTSASVRVSDLLRAYVRTGDTFGARLSKALVAGAAPSALPGIAVVLFIADVYPRLFWVDSHNKPLSRRDALSSACGVVEALLAPVRKVFDGSLRESFSTTMGAAMIRDVAGSRALSEDAVRDALTQLSPAFRLLTAAVHVGALFEPWSLRVSAPIEAVHHRVAGEAATDVPLSATLTSASGPAPWLAACVRERGSDIRETPVRGVTVSFAAADGFTAHAEFAGDASVSTDDTGLASVGVRLREESASTHAAGVPKSERIAVSAFVDRAPYVALSSAVSALLGEALARAIVSQHGADVFDRIASAEAHSVPTSAWFIVTYHE